MNSDLREYPCNLKDFQAFRVGLVRHLTSAEFAFLFMVSNLYVLYIDSELILRPVNTGNFMVLVRIQSNTVDSGNSELGFVTNFVY